MKITNEMVTEAYNIAKQVYEGKISRVEAKEEIANNTGMKEGSAQDYVTVFLGMIAGEEYRRTINTYATEYYFQSIKNDFGTKALENALKAAEKHTDYYATLSKGRLTSIEDLIDKYKRMV